MPQAAASAVFLWVGGTFGSLSTAAVAAIAYTTYAVTTLALTVGMSKLSQALAGKPKIPGGSQSRDVVVKSTIEPRQLIYGETRTAGTLVFYGCSGTENRFLWFVIAVAGHQCEDITDCWVGPTLVPDADIDGSGAVSTAAFIDGDSVSRLLIRRHLGAGNQAVDSELDSELTEWTSNHKGLGVAYVAYRLDRAEDVWDTGAPSAFYHLVKGRRLYDPRLDSTNGGSGSHRANDATTWAWSNNSALAVRDYVSGGSIVYTTATPNKKLGVAELDARIDDAYVIAAANICDEDPVIPPADSPDITQARYTCDGQISCGTPHMQNLQVLLSSMIGHLSYVGGKYRIFAGAYDTPTVDLVEDDIQGPIEVVTHPQGEDNYNLVTGTFYDELKSWQLTPFPAQTNSTYETNDGGQRPRSIELLATRTSYRAQRIAQVHLKQSRNKSLVKLTQLSPKAMNISEWETFTVTISEYGWNAQVMRCLEWEFLPNGFIAITARLESSAAYADPAVGDYVTAGTSTTPAPQIELPSPPTALTALGDPNGILLSVTPPPYFPRGDTIEIWEHTSSTPFASAVKIDEARATLFRVSKRDTTTSYFWATTRSRHGNVSTNYPSGAGVAGAADLNETTDIAPDAATEVFSIEDAFAGTGFGTTGEGQTILDLTFTPSVDSIVEITTSVMGSGFYGDSGRQLRLYVTPSGGSAVFLSNVSNDNSLQTLTMASTYVATGGVEIEVKITSYNPTGPDPEVYTASLRATVVKR